MGLDAAAKPILALPPQVPPDGDAVTHSLSSSPIAARPPNAALRQWGHQLVIIFFGLAALAIAPWMEAGPAQYVDLILGIAMLAYGLGRIWQKIALEKASKTRLSPDVMDMLMRDPSPIVLADKGGKVLHQNPAAKALFVDIAADAQDQVTKCLSKFVASPRAMVARLAARAQALGCAVEELATREGALRLIVQTQAEGALILWRIEILTAKAGAGAGADTISLPMLTANKAGVVMFCNLALRALLGARPKTLRDIAAPEAWRSGEELLLTTPTGPVSVMLVELPSTGARREIYLLPLPPEQTPAADSTVDFESMPVALMIFDPDGTIRAANGAAREIMGDMLHGAPYFHDLFDALGRPVSDWLADVAQARLPTDAQVLRLNKSHAERSDFVHVSLRRMVQNARPQVLAVIQDANVLKTLEAQFAQSQKMQAIGQLAGGVAHDFNNLLTAISGNCDLLLLRHMGDDPSYPDLLQIRQNANRAAALVAQLLAFSRKQNLQPEYLDMQDVFSDLTHLLNRLVGEKLNLVVQHGTHLGTIRADRRQLEQVIVNLVVNARDAMPQGGAITITTEPAHLAADMTRDNAVVPAGDYAKISVADTGIGMAEDMLAKIFEPFFTTKRAGEGTGLGLSTAYGIVKQSGGFIFVDSALGQGTTFTLYFPIHSRPEEKVIDPPPAKPALLRQGEGVVLLVEDEPPVRAFAARALRLRGYTVLEAATGEEALSLLRESSLQVDLFISDVIMPGLDGPTWVREAKASRPDVPVIFVSGYAEDVMSEHQQRIANSTFLPKPFSLAELTMTVQDKLQHLAPAIASDALAHEAALESV